MSVKVMGLVWDHYPRGGGEFLTALALADHSDHGGKNVRPGITGLARKTRQSIRTVQNHASRMRREQWLLPVRYADGGRGFATEYRINPAWLEDPAEFAPIAPLRNLQRVQSATERVQTATEKGADGDTKGCKAFAPQPSGTVIEPSTTTGRDTPSTTSTVVVHKLEYPEILKNGQLESARQVLERCPLECRQLVLDELAGIALHRGVRSPLGLLRQLVQAVVDGRFEPNRGIEITQQRRRRAAAAKAARQRAGIGSAADRAAPVGPQPISEVAERALQQLRAMVSDTGGPSR
jgi:hypothetical protein